MKRLGVKAPEVQSCPGLYFSRQTKKQTHEHTNKQGEINHISNNKLKIQ